MMKKVFLSLFMAIVCLPLAFAQTKDGHQIVTTSETVCKPYTWSVDSVVYTHDTTVMVVTDSVIYILDLTVRTASTDTTDIADTAACVYRWNDSIWKTAGYHIGILTDANGCDSVVRVNLHLTFADTARLDTIVCDSVLAPWGEIVTESVTNYSTWTTAEGCERNDSVRIVVANSYLSPIEEAEADCRYLWNGQTITDTNIHTYTRYTAVGHCDSVLRIKVNLDFLIEDSLSVTNCGAYTWNLSNQTYDSTGVYTYNETAGQCVTSHILTLTVNPMYNNANPDVRDVTAGCFYVWGDSTFTDTNVVHVATVRTVDGCDSIGAIRIIGYTNIEEETIDTVYCGNAFTWMGLQITDPGNYDSTTVSDNGCTTNHHLILTKTYRYDTLAEVSRCASYTHQFNSRTGFGGRYSVTFTTSGLHVTDPDYNDTLFPDHNLYSKDYSTGCITFHALPLTIIDPEQRVRPDVDTTVCDTLVFKVGISNWAVTNTFTSSIDTTIVAKNRSTRYLTPCFDSIANLHLIVNYRTNIDTNVAACDSFYWDFTDVTYTKSTTVSKIDTSRVNDEGCYYYGRLNLSIHYAPKVQIEGDWMLEHGQSTTLHAVSTESNLQHKWYKNNETTPFSTDTVVTIDDPQDGSNLSIHLVSNVINQECMTNRWITITYNNLGVEEADGVAVDIYPNPTSRIVNLSSASTISRVEIYNALGQQVLVDNNGGHTFQLDLGRLAAGNYTMRISAADGSQTTRKLIVSK